jgi:ABC-type multidrug transport system ATPase subunit
MRVEAQNLTRSFGRQKVIDSLSFDIKSGERWSVTGSNGSGKSTLLKLVAGVLRPNSGTLNRQVNSQEVEGERLFQLVSFTGPYVEIIEDLTLLEHLDLHFRLREMIPGYSSEEILRASGLSTSGDKFISQFSSGMKQRFKLCLALFTKSEILLLDEPTSNLDATATQWFQDLLSGVLGKRTLIVGSNHQDSETFLCDHNLQLKGR